MLVLGLCGLLPAQDGLALGLEYIFTGAAFATGIFVFAHNFPEDGLTVLGSRGPRTVRLVLSLGGTLFPVIAGIGLVAGLSQALYLLMPAAIGCLYLSIGNAWVFAVEIPRRKQQGSGD